VSEPTAIARADMLQLFVAAAARHPNRPALSGPRGRTLTYRQLVVAVVGIAKSLRANGFAPDEQMLSLIRRDPESIVLALGTVAAGGSVILAEPGSPPELFAAAAAFPQPRWAVAQSTRYAAGSLPILRAFARRRGLLLPDYAALGVRTLRAGRWLPGVPSGSISLRRLRGVRGIIDAQPLPGLAENLSADAVVVFTAGTTGPAKAVVHTRGSFGAAVPELISKYQIGPRARVYTDQLMVGLSTLAAGAHWRLPAVGAAPRMDPARFARSVGRATHIFLAPADLAAVVEAVSERLAPRPPALQHIVVGGAPVLPTLVSRTLAVLPDVQVLAVYGTTEITPIAIADGLEELAGNSAGDPVGNLLPGVQARIAPDGELIVHGPHLAKGYLGEPPFTEFATGDLAEVRGRSLVLLGRKQEMFTRGNTTINPAQYEPSIEALPGVGHAALVGASDPAGAGPLVLVLQPAGQRVDDHPLASEPKQSNTRDDDGMEPQQVSVLVNHPLAAAVRAALPSVVEAAALPDQILVLSSIPTMARDRKTDRVALRRLLQELPAQDTEPIERTERVERVSVTAAGRVLAVIGRRFRDLGGWIRLPRRRRRFPGARKRSDDRR